MHSSRPWTAAASAIALAAASLAGAIASAPSAAALTPPVAFTADDLSTYQTNGIVYALAQAGGTVFAGGTFSAIRPAGSAAGTNETPAVNFAAFDAATGAPTGCSLSFTVGDGSATVRALAVSPDGKTLYAGGYFGAVNGVGVNSIAAIDIATCTPSTTFHPAVNATVRALAVTSDTVYLGGDFSTVAGASRAHFAALTTAGAATSWTADTDDTGRAVDITPDGAHVAIGGDFFTVNGTASHALAITDAGTGAVSKAYPSGYFSATSVVKDITSDSTGLYTGNEGSGGGVFDGRTAFNLADFSERWRDTCLGATQALQLYQNVLYSASHAHDCSSIGEYPDGQRRHLLAEGVNSYTKLPWFPDTNDGNGEGIGPRALTISTSGSTDYLWFAGEFTTVNGVAQQSLGRVSNGTDTGAPTVPQVKAESITPGVVNLRWRSSFDTDDGTLTYKVYKNGGTTPVYTTTGYSLPWSRPQITWTDPDVTAGSTYSYRITASDGTNTTAKSAAETVTAATTAQAYPAKVLADGANLYWRYDETSAAGAYAADTSTTGDNGVQWNSPTRAVAGAVAGSTAISYNGAGQWTYSDKSHPRPSAYTIETWFKTTTTTGGKLVGMGNRVQLASSSSDKQIYMANNGRLYFGVNSSGLKTVNTITSYNDGNWHHVVATQGGDGMKLYVDGALKASNFLVTSSQNYTGYWRVGGDAMGTWPNRSTSDYFTGAIDETAIYPSVLTATQVAAHYTLGTSG